MKTHTPAATGAVAAAAVAVRCALWALTSHDARRGLLEQL